MNEITVARFYIENGTPEVELATFIEVDKGRAEDFAALKLPFKGIKSKWWTLTALQNAAVDLTESGQAEVRNAWGEIEQSATPGNSRPAFRLYDYVPRAGVTFVTFEEWRKAAEEERQARAAIFPDEEFAEIPSSPPRYVLTPKSIDGGLIYAVDK